MVTIENLREKKDKIAVVGLGYVGLPLAVHLSKHFDIVGFDVKTERIDELKNGYDRTHEIADTELAGVKIRFSSDPGVLTQCRFIVVAVPTPIDTYHIPNLNPLKSASETVGRHMREGTCIVFESTVYPGATEEVCLPILEKESEMVFGSDFTIGYSPERINPGDKIHTLDRVVKIVSGSDEKTRHLLENVYGSVVAAGIHPASSIKVAEAAKVIENTQRDLNIALMNELSMIFDKMDIDTTQVLEAAGTKWNFLPFKPGLVGGHCIGVDPYYLTFKAESIGYHPDMILAGRRINDGMGKYIAEKTVKMLIREGLHVKGARIAVLGITFKEDVPDLRNSKVVDIVKELKDYGINVMVHDPIADAVEAMTYYNITLRDMTDINDVDAVIVPVMHQYYKEQGLARLAALCRKDKPLVIDVKGLFDLDDVKGDGIGYWRL